MPYNRLRTGGGVLMVKHAVIDQPLIDRWSRIPTMNAGTERYDARVLPSQAAFR